MACVRAGEGDCHCPICDFLAQAQNALSALNLGNLELAVVDFTVESKQLHSTPASFCYFTRGPPATHLV